MPNRVSWELHGKMTRCCCFLLVAHHSAAIVGVLALLESVDRILNWVYSNYSQVCLIQV